MDELKPCPFCGGEAEYWGDDGKAGCASDMGSGCPFDEVMYAHEWNTRPIEDALRAERDELRRMLDAVLALEEPVETALRAEVERLKAELDKTHEAWLDWQVGLRTMGEVFNNRPVPACRKGS